TADCDDTDAGAYPGAPEVPDDGIDSDCNGVDTITCLEDLDQDGYGSAVVVLAVDGRCDLGQREAALGGDCDDSDGDLHPGALEIKGDGIDQDCDGTDLIDCYEDLDDDGHGAVPPVLVSFPGDCGPEPGMASQADDCDDDDAAVYPGAYDLCGDGIDSDCNGLLDDDGDGLSWIEEAALGTDDCVPDFDGDGALDGAEVIAGTDPLEPDSDGDGLLDGDEYGGLDPIDSDGDGLIDALDDDDDDDTALTIDELPYGAGDADGDGVPNHLDDDDDDDTLPTRFEDADASGSVLDDDTDGDGLGNWLDDDDDGDGVLTSSEVPYGADHLSADSDGDGIADLIEWGGGAAPRDSELCPPTWTSPCPDGTYDVVDSDDDNDGIPSEVEGTDDLDLDTVPNYLDPDSDGDGTFDLDEWVTDWMEDTDSDGVPNWLDDDDADGETGDPDRDSLSTGDELAICVEDLCALPNSPDSDGDGVDDGLEVPDPASPADTDGDGLPDVLDDDDDGDGFDTRTETGLACAVDGLPSYTIGYNALGLLWTCPDGEPIVPSYRDTDGDGLPDYRDPDDDGNGIPTADEPLDDVDGDGIVDPYDTHDRDGPVGDADGDGILNQEEAALGTDPYDPDSDGDGLIDPDELSWLGGVWITQDSDGDGLHDAIDADDDGDSIPTAEEGPLDTDGDGVPDYLDIDSDGDGKPDADEAGLDADCDGRADRIDADDEGPCDPGTDTDTLGSGYTRQGCSCGGGASGPLGWLAVLGVVGLLRRRGQRAVIVPRMTGAGRQRPCPPSAPALRSSAPR
ncbi:MAG TPA: hypothetical protein ENK18_01600, partial [Deltaproteobacteria bacterium]|nr:hypothetical protein [Deltaproteobacteria bacterium]